MATEIKSTSIKSQNIIAEPQANKPGSPEQGQIIQATGTGDIAKGIYQYSGASWVSLDNAQGDLETLRLIMSTDTDAVGFSSALNSTSTLAGNTNAIPHETSTGTGMLGALEVPSTGGDALLTEFDANKVFRYYSAGANNNNDYFGIPVDIPAQTRGQNIVIKFKYRTEEASATTSDGDFQVSVWDKSNGVKTTSTNTSTVAAGSAITVASSTGMAAGDRIWLESGGNAVNNVGNSITQAYITEVTNSTTIEISEDWTPASTAGSLVVSGWLSSNTQGLLPAADSDTNKVGKDFSIAVKTEEDTEQVVVWFSNKSTTTNVIELFFDGILVSQNKFLQASSKLPSEQFSVSGWDGSNQYGLYTAEADSWNTLDKLASVDKGTSTGNIFAITALQRIKIEFSFWYAGNGHAAYVGALAGNPSSLPAKTVSMTSTDVSQYIVAMNYPSSGEPQNCSGSVILEKGEVLQPRTSHTGAPYTEPANGGFSCTVTPEVSDVIILESQDEIFTDWTEFDASISTATGTAPSGLTVSKGRWRRVGSSMDIAYTFVGSSTSTSGTGVYLVNLPSGYSIDMGQIQGTVAGDLTSQNPGLQGFGFFDDTSNHSWYQPLIYSSTQFYLNGGYHGGNNQPGTGASGPSFGSTDKSMIVSLTNVPISGWNSNFNPLLSMPLVEIGNNMAEYSGYFNGTNVGYGKYVNTVYTDTLSTSGLCAVTAGTSTTAFNLLAQQRVKVTLSMTNGQGGTANWYYGVVAGTHASVTDHTVSFGDSSLDGYRISGTELEAASGLYSQTASFILEAGENLQVRTTNNGGTSYSGGINSLFHIVVEKDFSNTNMAHIIKPAVAVITEESAGYGAWGGDLGAVNTWQTRALNTLRGESWFVTLNDSTDTFTLEPGTYKVIGQSPLYAGNAHKARLYNSSDSVAVVNGQNSYSNATYNGQAGGFFMGTFSITSSKDFIVQHIFNNDNGGISQGGFDSGGTNSGPSMFTTVMIEKLK